MSAIAAANDDEDGRADRGAAIRAAFEGAKRVHLPPGAGGGDGSDPTHELGLAKLQRNDIGNGERFIARQGDDFVVVREIGWHGWTGTHWSKLEGETRAQVAAQQVAVAIRVEANAMEAAGLIWSSEDRRAGEDDAAYRARVTKAHGERIGEHRRWARASGNTARLTAMLNEAAPHLTVDVEAMDPNPWRFNARNGTLELLPPDGVNADAAFQFVAHDRAHKITRVAACVHKIDAASPEWQKFLDRVQPDPEMQRFLARWCGYCLTGSVAEQALLLNVGLGANGKTTFIEAVSHAMGDYATVIPFAALLHQERTSGSQATPDLARLPGTRFVTAAEADLGARLSESVVKTLTGGDRMLVRELNKGFFEFEPQFKLTLGVNNKPDIRGTDEGIWRRLLVAPWPVTIPTAERDPRLLDKLKAEAAGILRWMLDGYGEYRELRLRPPGPVTSATIEYREERDRIGSFIEAVCEPAADERVQAKALYEAYLLWCGVNAVDPITSTLFGRLVDKRPLKDGSEISKERIGLVFYRGLALRQDVIEELRQAGDRAKAGRGGQRDVGEPPPPAPDG